MGKQKMIFLGIVGAIVVLIASVFLFIGNSSTTKVASTGPDVFNVWVVGDETAGYSDIITGFKAKYPEYGKTAIAFTKFSSYADYEKILLNVMIDGNSPDIFVINNNSISENSDGILESKIVGLPTGVASSDYLSKNFNKVFDELVVQNEETNEEGKKIKVAYLKGIPMGFETLGVFYNYRKVNSIPLTWSDLDKEIIDSAKEDYITIGMGLGSKYITNPSDILTLLFLQNGVTGYHKLGDPSATNAIKAYKSFSNDTNNGLINLKGEMDNLGLTTTDLFVRGKVGMIIGYPSLIREIQLAKKRVGGNYSMGDKFLRTSPIFQISSENSESSEKTNLVNYNFFALSKYSKNQNFGFRFLNYLATSGAQESYSKAFPYYIPAFKALEESKSQETLEVGYDRTKFADFIPNDVTLRSFSKGLKNEYDSYLNINLDLDITGGKTILPNLQGHIECNINHLIKNSNYETQCE